MSSKPDPDDLPAAQEKEAEALFWADFADALGAAIEATGHQFIAMGVPAETVEEWKVVALRAHISRFSRLPRDDEGDCEV